MNGWQKIDAITYRHNATGMHIVNMADRTWSIATGPVENMEIGLAKWVSHKFKRLRDAKSMVAFHHRMMKRAPRGTTTRTWNDVMFGSLVPRFASDLPADYFANTGERR